MSSPATWTPLQNKNKNKNDQLNLILGPGLDSSDRRSEHRKIRERGSIASTSDFRVLMCWFKPVSEIIGCDKKNSQALQRPTRKDGRKEEDTARSTH
jgi:hypothetical protein